jgi:hypothetical protein
VLRSYSATFLKEVTFWFNTSLGVPYLHYSAKLPVVRTGGPEGASAAVHPAESLF